jgi:hypothetical protein
MTAADKIRMIDTNGDGVLTEEEHVTGARSMFEKMDTNGDGFLTKAEVQAGHDTVHAPQGLQVDRPSDLSLARTRSDLFPASRGEGPDACAAKGPSGPPLPSSGDG